MAPSEVIYIDCSESESDQDVLSTDNDVFRDIHIIYWRTVSHWISLDMRTKLNTFVYQNSSMEKYEQKSVPTVTHIQDFITLCKAENIKKDSPVEIYEGGTWVSRPVDAAFSLQRNSFGVFLRGSGVTDPMFFGEIKGRAVRKRAFEA